MREHPSPAAPPARGAAVQLRQVTSANLPSVLALRVRPDQRRFVADNACSLAEARRAECAWLSAIYADETPVGFLMMHEDHSEPEYYLWRLMIDARYQQQGFGRRALELLIERVRGLPRAKELLLSYTPGAGSPQPFYAGLGFEETGLEDEDGERLMRLGL